MASLKSEIRKTNERIIDTSVDMQDRQPTPNASVIVFTVIYSINIY